MNGEKKIDVILAITLVGFAASVIYHFTRAHFFGLDFYPYNTFLFNPNDRFNDFFNIYRATATLKPYDFPVSVYFPFTFMTMYPFSVLSPIAAFCLFTLMFIGYFLYYLFAGLPEMDIKKKLFSVLVLSVLSYPFLFSVDRLNVECLLFIFLALFLHYYGKGEDWKSVVFLSLAIAMKLYPVVFVVLFITDRKFKYLSVMSVLVVVVSVLSAWALREGVFGSFEGLKHNLVLFSRDYFLTNHGLQHNASLFGIARLLDKMIYGVRPLVDYYAMVALILFACVAAYIVFLERKPWKNVALLTFTMILLPQVSYDYKLIHLFLPLMLFVKEETPGRFSCAYAVAFGLLLTPKDYYIIVGDISIAVILNPTIMVLVMLMIATERILTSKVPNASVF